MHRYKLLSPPKLHEISFQSSASRGQLHPDRVSDVQRLLLTPNPCDETSCRHQLGRKITTCRDSITY